MSTPRSPRGRARRAVFAVAAAVAVVASLHGRDLGRGDRSTVLARVLAKRGLSVAPGDVIWIDGPSGLVHALTRSARAVVRASPAPGEPNDIYLVDAQLSPEGVLLDVGDAYDLSETSSADEGRPVIEGARVAYVARSLVGGGALTVHVDDLAGQPPATSDWTRLERLQNAITNLQQTGRFAGIGKRTYAIGGEGGAAADEAQGEAHAQPAPPAGATLAWSGVTLVITEGSRSARVAVTAPDDAPAPAPWLSLENAEVARPGNLVTWAVDRVRAVPWIGDDTMQTIKAVAFTALDFVLRHKEQVTGDNGADGIAADLGQTQLEPPTRSIPVDPEIGWPPAPLEPWVTPSLPGEGVWHPQDQDPFVRTNPGLPAAFLTTFVRSDRERKATRVYVALWDPRQVELHMMAGTVEPKGATGEAGPGLIPRTPEVMKRVVAASNAGFQALHGEFGMMADGVVYLPPKPFAATVAELRDGSTAFGTWPKDTSIPEQVLSYRQNMTVMVQDEKFNPYNRTWWGGTPPGWADKTHTVRTGICLTKEKFVAYFYGADISPEALAQAMIQARCIFGIALDMNAGHSGLEFYKVAPAAELEPLGRPLHTDWEAEGDVPLLDGWRFRGRRLIRGMGLMHFPRYIKREARDYFYMTLRHVLPEEPIAPVVQPPKDGEGQWRLKGLPQHGFPYALALTDVRIDAKRPDVVAHVLKIDPRTVRAVPASTAPGKSGVVALLDAGGATVAAGGKNEPESLYASTGAFSIGSAPPVAGAVRLATGVAEGGAAAAALGIEDESGMLVYAELAAPPATPAAADAAALGALLKNLGCSSRLLLAHPLAMALGGDTDLAGAAVHPPTGATTVRLERADAPGGRRFFEDTPIVPFDVWYPLQQQRIRYFKKPHQDEAPAAGDDAAEP